jgi:hypothetical protein
MIIRATLAVSLLAMSVAQADTIIDWDVTAADVITASRMGGNPATRALAMMHVAMSDSINTVQNRYTRYVATLPVTPGASADAAAATAARQVLLQLFPAQKTTIEAAYEASMKRITDDQARKDGVAIGEKVAEAVQADRAADGTSVPDTYRPMTTPGVWVPTTPPLFAEYARAKPWVLKGADQFRPGAPPALPGALYARDYNETKNLGGAKSTQRTADQTEAVKFWGNGNITPSWFMAARQLSEVKQLPLADNARMFALLSMAVANTFIADWDAKFTYNLWRPVTAIRNGDNDGNDATDRDVSWTSLNPAPMHPEYPSQAAIVSGAGLAIIESVFGPNPPTPITVTGQTDAKAQRQLSNVTALANETIDIRIWGGIHFRNSLETGRDMGRKIAAYMIENSIKPIHATAKAN